MNSKSHGQLSAKMIQSVTDSCLESQRKPTTILLLSSVLLLTWKYCCTPQICSALFTATNANGINPQAAGTICHFVSCFLLLGVLPAVIVKLVFGDRLRDYGVSVGNVFRTIRSFLIFTPVMLIFAYLGSQNSAMIEHYPINHQAGQSASMFILHAGTFFLYFVGWEFYFRGFMLFGLRDSFGDVNAVLVQTLVSVLLHIGSPPVEAFGAIAGGMLWGVLALRTRSLLSGLGQHFLLAIFLDWLICYRC